MKGAKLLVSTIAFIVLCGCGNEAGQVQEPVSISSESELSAYLSGFEFESLEDYELGLGQNGEVFGKWKIVFSGDDNSFQWYYSDVLENGEYAFLEANRFSVTSGNTSFVATIYPGTEQIEWQDIIYRRVVGE